MKSFAATAAAALVALGVCVAAATAQPARVTCPLKPGVLPTGGYVQWAFSDSGPPAGNMITASYVHGLGHWTNGRAFGTACTTDRTASGVARDLVLTVRGKSTLTPHFKQHGLLGVRISLPMVVSTSDDAQCAAGTTGTITMFASYYAIHADTMRIHFSGSCATHDLSYGSPLHVYIAHNGKQVNTA